MWANVKSFLDKPFRAEMSALDWFLFIGLILAIMVAWRLILNHIAAEIAQ